MNMKRISRSLNISAKSFVIKTSKIFDYYEIWGNSAKFHSQSFIINNISWAET